MTSPEVITYSIESDEESDNEEYLNYTPCKVESAKGITSYILDYDQPNDLYVPLSSSLMKLVSSIRPVGTTTQEVEWIKNASILSPVDSKDILKKIQKYERGSFDKVLNGLFLKILLCRWKEYYLVNELNYISARKQVYCNVYRYLRRNWNYLEPYVKIFKTKCSNAPKIDFDELLVLSSPYRQLKSFLCSEPTIQNVYQTTTPLPHPVRYKVSAESLNNWPFVSIKIDLPTFGFVRENYNHNEFKIINLEHHYKHTNESCMNTNLHYKQLEKSGEFLPSFITTYLNQFKNFLFSASLSSSLKDCLFVIISQVIKDISCIEGAISLKTDYYMNFAPYPYVRYLAYQPSLNLVEYNQTVPVTKDALNLRMQQLTYPAVKFQLFKFNATYGTDSTGKISFKFSDSEYSTKCLENSVIYECQLCSKVFKSKDAAIEMSNHVAYLHGYEPSWTCTKCDVMFPSEVLSRGRWAHKCVVP